jgi:hypothetical protein
VQVRGLVVFMEIGGVIAKSIFDKNTNREFYIEQNFPIDWMYPHLEPHGLVFKIDREPLPELSDDIVSNDRDFWTGFVKPMIGDWLTEGTGIAEVAAFAENVYLKQDFTEFKGDREYFKNDYSCKMFSRLRLSAAQLYVWRMNHAAGEADRERMRRAADFAFREAMALCPYSREMADSYGEFLRGQNRATDAGLVIKTADRCYR